MTSYIEVMAWGWRKKWREEKLQEISGMSKGDSDIFWEHPPTRPLGDLTLD